MKLDHSTRIITRLDVIKFISDSLLENYKKTELIASLLGEIKVIVEEELESFLIQNRE